MNAFEYVNPSSLKAVPGLLSRRRDHKAVVMAGGMDLLGELKDKVIAPDRVVNLKALNLRYIRHGRDGMRLGATTALSDITGDAELAKTYAALAEAAESVASVQIRNVGTLGGNLCQRPRCWYYRDEAFPCLKKGGHKCYAVEGENKYHAVMGGGPCYIVHPSDLAPALIVLNAGVTVLGPGGERKMPVEDFFVLPMENLYAETVLQPNEIVTEVFVPRPRAGTRSTYLKFKEKGSMDFALAAAAVALQVEGGICRSARVALGGVAPRPWVVDASALVGQSATEARAVALAESAFREARPMRDNGFKVSLCKTMIKRAVMAVV